MSSIQNIEDNLVRLRRAYDFNINGYDRPALLDMAHILRVWVDMKNEVNKTLEKHGRIFHAYSLSTDIKKILRASREPYLLSFFYPNGVQTTTMGLYKLLIVKKGLLNVDIVQKAGIKSRYSFLDWMGTESVRMAAVNQSGTLEYFQVSRENLIRRLANTDGGSHPSGHHPRPPDKDDIAIKVLFEMEVSGIPAPYYLILHTASEILQLEKINPF
jgi:hypothetical protein